MKFWHVLSTADRVVAVSMVFTLGGVVLGAALGNPTVFGFNALLVIGILLVGWYMTRDRRLGWLLVFGVVVGIAELWADWLHVTYLHSLTYVDYFGFKVLASPSYMPIGWWFTSVQFAYLALRLVGRWSRWKVVGLITLLGMSIPPWYEEFAAPARAWYYAANGPMLSNTPLWIIFTYGGCMFSIATMALDFYRPGAWKRALVAGLFTGAGIMYSGVFCFSLLGR